MQVSEGRLLESLRAEVASAEGQLEEERASHAAARRAAQQREQQLEVWAWTSKSIRVSPGPVLWVLPEERFQQAMQLSVLAAGKPCSR